MPNVIHDLIVELARVQSLLSQLDDVSRHEAQQLLRFGREQMALNCYEGIREALDDLREFGRPKPGDAPK